MKRKVVEVDTGSARKGRDTGDAPMLGQVAKVAGKEKSAEAVREDDYLDDEDAAPGEWLIRLGMISALLIGLIVGGGLIYYTAISKLRTARMTGSGSPSSVEKETEGNPLAHDSVINEAEALDLVRRGLAVRFASKVTDYFRYTENLEALRVVEFLKGLSESDGLVVRMEYLEPVSREGFTMARVRVHFQSGRGDKSRDAYLVENPEGEWRIDYESFAEGGEPETEPDPEPDSGQQ